MKHLKIAGLCLVAMFAVSMVVAAAASAANPIWEDCQETGTSTKYSEHQCLTAEGSGKWSWGEVVSVAEPVRILAMTLRLEDEKTLVGKSTVQCGHVTIEGSAGSVGPGKKGEITVAKVEKPNSECERVEGGCETGKIEEIKGAHLPWDTELFETEGQAQTHLAGTGGEPGWEVKCKTALGSKLDTCLQEEKLPETVTLLNVATKNGTATELLVLGKFLRKHKAKCSEGGKESGVVTGQIAILLTNGWGIRVS